MVARLRVQVFRQPPADLVQDQPDQRLGPEMSDGGTTR